MSHPQRNNLRQELHRSKTSLREMFQTSEGQTLCKILETQRQLKLEDLVQASVEDVPRLQGAILLLDDLISGFRGK